MSNELISILVLIGIFVYWFIFQNVSTSFDRVTTRATKRVLHEGGVTNYSQLLGSADYQQVNIDN